MSKYLYTSKNEQIQIKKTPIAKGGEGAVYNIKNSINFSGCCVKIYFKPTQLQKNKLSYMIANSPHTLTSPNHILCWPREIVYDNGKFVGFIMPLAYTNSISLYEVSRNNINKNLGSQWNKFDRNNANNIKYRLQLCVNFAIAIHTIHSLNRYVIIDIKPQNCLITSDGKIAVIDLDSIQISNGTTVAFHGKVATPEYVPPEGWSGLKPANNYIPQTWDRFILAIIFYQIMFGLHPFAVTAGGVYQHSTQISDKIKSGLFPFGSKSNYVTVRPQPHDNFYNIPSSLQNLFLKAFEKGHTNLYVRPSAEEWGKAIYAELQKGVTSINKFQPTIPTPSKPAIKQNITYPQQRIHSSLPKIRYANLGERLVAFIIDLVVGTIIFIILFLAIGFTLKPRDVEIFATILSTLTFWLYYSTLESSDKQATFGKRLMKIKVVDMNKNQISFWHATGRHIGKIVSAFTLLMGFLMALFTEKKQTLHDIMAGCLVIKK